MSDAVNLASRLEGANKFYGTTIIASETTVALAGEAFAWRELDAIRVKGRTQALRIYELLALPTALTSSQQALIARTTPRDLRTGAPANSHLLRRPLAIRPRSTGRHRCFATRARELAQDPPGEDWDPIRTLQEK